MTDQLHNGVERGPQAPAFTFPKTREVIQQAIDAHAGKQYARAHEILTTVLNNQPDNVDALFQMATLLLDTGNHGVAANLFSRIVNLRGDHLSALMNLGSARRRCHDLDGAGECFRMAINMLTEAQVDESMRADLIARCYGNLAGLYGNNGTPQEMERLSCMALAKDPENVVAGRHLGLALLEQGRWAEARGPYRKRMLGEDYHARNYHSDATTPEWDGKTVVEVLAVHGEQGVGDEIMFAPAIHEIEGYAETLLIECTTRLVPAFKRMFPRAGVYGTHEALMAEWRDKVTAKVSMCDLFLARRDKPEDCPGTPYLRSNPHLSMQYRQKLDALGSGPKIGIAWRGGTDKTHMALRKVPLKMWAPILDVPGCRFLSIQYTPRAFEEAEAYGVPHWHEAATDIEHHIACISQLDLVITVSQSALHFAGALGTPCWVLTPSKPDWRLGMSGESLPIYRSVRLFRQQGTDWTAVINNVAEALWQFAQKESGAGNSSASCALPADSSAVPSLA